METVTKFLRGIFAKKENESSENDNCDQIASELPALQDRKGDYILRILLNGYVCIF